jgi:hypothetical protein
LALAPGLPFCSTEPEVNDIRRWWWARHGGKRLFIHAAGEDVCFRAGDVLTVAAETYWVTHVLRLPLNTIEPRWKVWVRRAA